MNKGNESLEMAINETQNQAAREILLQDALDWLGRDGALNKLGHKEEANASFARAAELYDEAIERDSRNAMAWQGNCPLPSGKAQ